MPRRIKEDHRQFREVMIQDNLPNRRVTITIPQMDLPPFLFGHVVRKPKPTEPVDWIKEGF